MKKFVDFIYGTQWARERFEKNHPGEQVLAADACKATRSTTEGEIARGTHWLTAKRAVLLLTERRIVCGNWSIPLESIAEARLFIIGRGRVLKIATHEGMHYQFGIQANPEWTSQQVLPLELEPGKLRYSYYSILIRILALAILGYWAYRTFIKQ